MREQTIAWLKSQVSGPREPDGNPAVFRQANFSWFSSVFSKNFKFWKNQTYTETFISGVGSPKRLIQHRDRATEVESRWPKSMQNCPQIGNLPWILWNPQWYSIYVHVYSTGTDESHRIVHYACQNYVFEAVEANERSRVPTQQHWGVLWSLRFNTFCFWKIAFLTSKTVPRPRGPETWLFKSSWYQLQKHEIFYT